MAPSAPRTASARASIQQLGFEPSKGTEHRDAFGEFRTRGIQQQDQRKRQAAGARDRREQRLGIRSVEGAGCALGIRARQYHLQVVDGPVTGKHRAAFHRLERHPAAGIEHGADARVEPRGEERTGVHTVMHRSIGG